MRRAHPSAFAAPPTRLPLPPRRPLSSARCRTPPRRPPPTLREHPLPPSTPRPDGEDAAFLPQTIEYALRQAHTATAQTLIAGHTHLRVELPLGRTRKHWYRMSPMATSYADTALLAFHYASLFKGLCIHVVLSTAAPLTHPLSWVHAVHHVDQHDVIAILSKPPRPEQHRVIILAGMRANHIPLVNSLASVKADAIILFNSFLDQPLVTPVYPFVDTYVVRAMHKSAVMRSRYEDPWHVFVEIAVFEYEWVGTCESNWGPTQRRIDNFALSRHAYTKSMNGYWRTPYAGCEAGFWPFMTLACKDPLPLDGRILAKMNKEKRQKAQRPFGFF